uniref:Adenosine deaminase RNA specific B2 (inactive) n=1 Tax=Oryzias melastigma TaxID=30732 RepID=A0A3B3BXB8_ORYME
MSDSGLFSTGTNLEVKENEDEKNQRDHDILRKCRPSALCTNIYTTAPRALKRKPSLVAGKDHQSQFACKRSSWAVTQKNALVHLNELKPGLRYEIVSKTGPLHAPVFSVGVEVNGFHFEGFGSTKKQAKMRAAELALQSFIQFPNASQAHAVMGNFTNTHVDFAADKLNISDTFPTEFKPSVFETCDLLHWNTKKEILNSICNHKQLIGFTLDLISSANPKGQSFSTLLLEHLSPVALLSVLRPELRFMCLTERVHGRPKRNFIMVLRFEGKLFEGCGPSKRLAKERAAAAALDSLYRISLGPERKMMGVQNCNSQLPQLFADSVYHLVRNKYSQLTESSSHAQPKVLAGVVMSRGFDFSSAQVVSLATGTKCLDLEDVSDTGCILRDCHAEVISRRALVRFLYAQLELLTPDDSKEQSIFVRNKDNSFRLREGILFHMYVSSSPCGDARLNCPYETTAAYPSRRFRFHLRVKVNGGEGTLPVAAQRSRDFVLPSKPLLTMSCTDKLAKWCVVGVQGALLSHLVEPVYLHSLTVGTLCHTGHLARGMARRLAPVKHLPLPYRRQQLLFTNTLFKDVRPSGKASSISLNWSSGDGCLEEVSTSSGRRKDSGTPSRLCRHSLFTRWLQLQRQLNGPASGSQASTESFSACKMSAGRYQRALQRFGSALKAEGLGAWFRKPLKLGHFSVTV